MTRPAIFRAAESTAGVLLTSLLFAATNADSMGAGWLRGDRVLYYRVAFGISMWGIAVALFASRTMRLGPRILLGAVGGYFASAFAQFVVVPLIEGRSPLIYQSVVRFGITPALLAPVATLGWAAGAFALLLALTADLLRRRLLHQVE